MKVLVLDNYDSFTYNLVHMVEAALGNRVDVFLNNRIELDEVQHFDKIILSPGPGIPSEAGILIPLIKAYAVTKPILGVCLGHQAIAEAFGGSLLNLETVYHGIATNCVIEKDTPLFNNIPRQFEAGRYHSWIVNDADLPADLEVTARDDNGYIMALQHKTLDVQGVQFHPESVLTPAGNIILKNWLKQ